MAPINLPLYQLVMFPCLDPRIPDVEAGFRLLQPMNIQRKDVWLRSANGNRIHGWFLELPDTHRVFLFSHGKGNNIYAKLHTARLLLLCGGSVFMYDYQGFGNSEGRASIDASCDDAVAAYDYLIEKEHRSAKDIIAFGESFGCGVSGQLVRHRKTGGVILKSGFSSLQRAARDTLPWLKLYPDWAFPSTIVMDNVSVFKRDHPPLLIIHGRKDQTLDYKNATELFQESSQPKALLSIPEGGHGCYGTKDEFLNTVKSFLVQHGL
jgi:uncharacterized protein